VVVRTSGDETEVGLVQLIKGDQLSREEVFLRDHCSHGDF